MAAALRHARKSVAIATPFLSHEVAGYLARAAEEGTVGKRRMITALNPAAVEGGYLDPDGVEEFAAADFELRSLKNLHAKVLIADSRWGLIGSGNLTAAGANGGNAELGIILTPHQARQAMKLFDVWWKAAEQLDLSYLRSLRRRKRPTSPERRRRQGRGGTYRNDAGVDLTDFNADKRNSGYWLKILYGTEERMKASYWKGRFWVSDRHVLRTDGTPLYRPSYKNGEHVVIYVARGERKACPAIARVVAPPEFDPDFVASETTREDGETWGWVTWLDEIEAVDLAKAPTLHEIGVHGRSVQQHGHIRLSRAQYRKALAALRAV
jgi:hypothetical protein